MTGSGADGPVGTPVVRGGVVRPVEPPLGAEQVQTLAQLGAVLRRLRRRHARRHHDRQLSVRELARRSGYAYGMISEYLGGKVLPPTDRFDVLVLLLGAAPAEQRALATARDRVEERLRAARPGDRTIPRELPPGVPGFTGRSTELATLDLLRTRTDGDHPVAPVAVVTGTAGVGKTALAIRWAHPAAAGFPDGCLYVDLRGYAPEQPVPATEALAGLLRSLGVPGAEIPPGRAERAARYRTLLADRQALVLLDNARDSDHVRPLLPGGPGCVTVVTSRDALTGLVARHGARRIRLPPLPPGEAVGLLAELLGDRMAREPEAAASLAGRCARLPLPLQLARAAGDRTTEGRALISLGVVYWHLGRGADTLDCGERALAHYRERNDRAGQARVLGNLANVHKHLGDPAAALRYAWRALDLFREVEDPAGVAIQLGNLGTLLEERGRLPEAPAHLQQALALARTHGHRGCEANTLDTLGVVHRRMGRLPEARACHEQAVALARELADRATEGYALSRLGTVYEWLGQYAAAADHHHHALRIARQVGDPHLAVEPRTRLGDTLLAGGWAKRALRCFRRALTAATAIGDRDQRARAQHGIARAMAVLGATRTGGRY